MEDSASRPCCRRGSDRLPIARINATQVVSRRTEAPGADGSVISLVSIICDVMILPELLMSSHVHMNVEEL